MDKIKSGNVMAAEDINIDQVLRAIKALKLNAITLPIVIEIPSATSSEMTINQTSKSNAMALLEELKGMDIKVILEPYPWIANGSILETQYDPASLNDFFWNWKTVVLKTLIDEVAAKYDIYALIVASNFQKLEYATGYWQGVISYVRENYTGLVTYRTNWWITADWAPDTVQAYQNKLNNEIFGAVDFISVAAYFELNEENVPSSEELAADLFRVSKYGRGQNIYQELLNFYDKWKKPIFLGELGFSNRELAANEPWNPSTSNVVSEIAQANGFSAYRKVFEKEKWMMGFSVFCIGREDQNYNIVNRMAEIVVRGWYPELDNSNATPEAKPERSIFLEYELRPTMIKSNARYRGPSELGKYSNYIGETIHDMKLLGKVMDGDGDFKGHHQLIEDNFAAYFEGSSSNITSNIESAAFIVEQQGDLIDTNITKPGWQAYGGCIAWKTGDTYYLKSPGTNDPCGISFNVEVQEGQTIYIRMKAKRNTGFTADFRIGSANVNQNEGSTAKFSLNGTARYIGHSFTCKHKEVISINVDIQADASQIVQGIAEFEDFTVTLIDQNNYYMLPLNTSIKSKLRVIEDEVQSIIDNM